MNPTRLIALVLVLLVVGPVALRGAESAGEAGAPSTTTANTESRRVVIGLSPFLPESAKEEVYRSLVRVLLEELPLRSSWWVYDAYHLRTVAQAQIPAGSAFASSKLRATQFRGAIQELRRFLVSTNFGSETTTPVLAGDGALRLPQFLDFLAGAAPADASPPTVLLIGSPLYRDAKEPAFSMVNGYFPSDGHLRATRDRTVFGVADRQDRLPGAQVYWAWFGDPWVSEVHQERVRRFWSLFLSGQGARLGGFAGDLPTILQGARRPLAAETERGAHLALDPRATKVEMIRVEREVRTTDWILGDLPTATRREPPARLVGPVKIAIRWRGDIDLDLYARSRPDSTTLCFEHPRNDEGTYFKDHRSSPEREYEFVEFLQPVDLRQLEAAVNFYAGHRRGGVEGEVRVEFENRIYAGRFTIPATDGNQGRAGAGQEASWATLPILGILGVRAEEVVKVGK